MSLSSDANIPHDFRKPLVSQTARFMTASWKDDPEMTRFGGKSIWGFLNDRVRYKGPQVLRHGKMAVHSYWSQHRFVFPRAAAPIGFQYISMRFFHYSWPLPLGFVVYAVSFLIFTDHMINHFNRLAEEHGFLDGDRIRDDVPDIRLASASIGSILTVTARPLLGCLLTYKRHELPHLGLWTPVHMFVYTALVDFWFYVYHRAMHEVDILWCFHKTHHMAKHPSTPLAILAGTLLLWFPLQKMLYNDYFGMQDPVQEFCDILLIPLLAFICYPLPFHIWWLTTVYLLFIEGAGHTGTRLYWTSAITGPILQPLGMELVLEDHDLHHRNGWGRSSSNYGKQTRIWDVVFGTTRPRLEMVPENIDWDNQV